jgi:periplasmic protein TonB
MKNTVTLFFLGFCTLTILPGFAQDKAQEEHKNAVTPDSLSVFVVVEQMPEYPGGPEAMLRYISKNLRYPRDSKSNTPTSIFVEFIIERDGTITNVKTVRGVNEAMNREAERVVSTFPSWIPGMQNGRTVRVKQVLPIRIDYKI